MGVFDDTTNTKVRTITLYKKAIHYDIDALTYKLTEATMQGVDQKAKSAVASDYTDAFDNSVLERLTDYRNATLRRRMQFCLYTEDVEITSFDNKPKSEEKKYEFKLKLPIGFKDTGLETLGTKMHEYMVKGGLLDWYIQTGVSVNLTPLQAQVTELEDSIINMIRVPSSMKKPLQPFGPSGV